MNITVFEFLKRICLDGNTTVYLNNNGQEEAGTLAELKAKIGIEPFNPLTDGGQEKIKDFRIMGRDIFIFTE